MTGTSEDIERELQGPLTVVAAAGWQLLRVQESRLLLEKNTGNRLHLVAMGILNYRPTFPPSRPTLSLPFCLTHTHTLSFSSSVSVRYFVLCINASIYRGRSLSVALSLSLSNLSHQP